MRSVLEKLTQPIIVQHYEVDISTSSLLTLTLVSFRSRSRSRRARCASVTFDISLLACG